MCQQLVSQALGPLITSQQRLQRKLADRAMTVVEDREKGREGDRALGKREGSCQLNKIALAAAHMVVWKHEERKTQTSERGEGR